LFAAARLWLVSAIMALVVCKAAVHAGAVMRTRPRGGGGGGGGGGEEEEEEEEEEELTRISSGLFGKN
jgi:ribosomal protein L12E/L44/L45/RPP1/RPP2